MNKLIPFNQFLSIKKTNELYPLAKTSVVINNDGMPVGFVFGRDAFISFLEKIDEAFETKTGNSKNAYDNPAGNLIDLIEEKTPLNPQFVKDLKKSVSRAKKQNWIPLKDVMQSLHV